MANEWMMTKSKLKEIYRFDGKAIFFMLFQKKKKYDWSIIIIIIFLNDLFYKIYQNVMYEKGNTAL